ncbi:MAG: cupredoxin domain-containing protein [Bacteroidota bacterium]|nr:cupredoxin domain-containing protein [Bacteroidota bacterium]
MKTKYFAIFIATGLSIAFFSCSKSKTYSTGGGGNNNNPNSIAISGMAFPATTTVKVGSTVTWTNNDPMAHTVTSDDGVSFNSGSIEYGKSFSYTANTVGSFAYHCNFHATMKATLVVTQ